jgi:hypothetical protein
LQPVNPKGSLNPVDYGAGSDCGGNGPSCLASVEAGAADQELSLGSLPKRVWAEIHVTDWDPNNVCVSTEPGFGCLKTAQVKIDSSGWMGSIADCAGGPGGADLLPTFQACAANADCRTTVSGQVGVCASGEASKCIPRQGWMTPGGNICEPGFQDLCDADWILFGVAGVPAVDISTPNYRYGVTSTPPDVCVDNNPS